MGINMFTCLFPLTCIFFLRFAFILGLKYV